MGEGRTHEILRIKAREPDAIPAAGLAIERLAASVGLSSLEASRFRFVVEEVCADRIAHGFAPGQNAEVDIRLEHRPGEIVALVGDAGTPLDTGASGSRGLMAQLLDRGFVDELHASFRGREGNRSTAIKFIRNPQAALEAQAPPPSAEKAGTAAPDALEYREMRPEDAIELARCFYRTYGMSAPAADEVIYHPERCAERVRSGLHLGTVAVTAGGRIVGHTALERESLDDPLAIGGYLVVDPEFRGHGIAEHLTEMRFREGPKLGLRGMLAMAVTIHTASQKTSLANGGHEVGVLLAAQEARIVMRGIGGKQGHERHSIVAFYFPWNDLPLESHPPAAYRELIASIYANCGIERTIRHAPGGIDLESLPARSSIDVSILRAASHGKIRVKTYGRDFLAEMLHLVGDLHHHHVAVIRLELPLTDPLTAIFGAAAEELGFSFAAVFPGTAAGDLLCMQSLKVEVNPADIHTASEHGAALLKAVVESRERVLSSKTARTIEGAERALKESI
jgi:anti-sigma regulatory factor (Ser/Thr protein kinase)/GNAT superfamily N-acetyltransferase